MKADFIKVQAQLQSQSAMLSEALQLLRDQKSHQQPISPQPRRRSPVTKENLQCQETTSTDSKPNQEERFKAAFIKPALAGYEISLTGNLGIYNLFCDYHEYNLKDNAAWSRMSREVGRCRSVVNYMLTHATKEQLSFLSLRMPPKGDDAKKWTEWLNSLKEISRSVTQLTMATLIEQELKCFGEKVTKSKAGAKQTATLSAVDRRLTKLKAANGVASLLQPVAGLTSFFNSDKTGPNAVPSRGALISSASAPSSSPSSSFSSSSNSSSSSSSSSTLKRKRD